MERNPVRLVWRNSRLPHVAALLVLLLMAPVNWLLLELPRILVDDAVLGAAFKTSPTAPFMAMKLALPRPLSGGELVLFQGVTLERPGFFVAGCALVIALLALRSLLISLVAFLRSAIARRMAALLRMRLFTRVAAARGGGQDEAAEAARLAGSSLTAIAWFFGDAIIVPAMALSQLAIVLAFGASVGLHSGAMLLGLTLANVAVILWLAHAEDALNHETGSRQRAVTEAMRAAAQRADAIRAHGAIAVEEGYFRSLLARIDAVWRPLTRRVSLAAAARGFLREFGPLLMIAWGCWWVMAGQLTIGGMVALAFASVLLQRPVNALVSWRRERDQARAIIAEVARAHSPLLVRSASAGAPAAAPALQGPLAVRNLAAFDPASGLRVSGVSFETRLPAHVALVGEAGSGVETFAALLGGMVSPSSGEITVNGAPLQAFDGPGRARRIAYAGGAPIILAASVRDNLLYGCAEWDPERGGLVNGPDDATLQRVIAVAGLQDAVHALGLAAPVENGADPDIARRLIEARRALRAALARSDAASLVDPFDPEAYNVHATVAENLMFGLPVGDTFSEAHLASHPFMRAVLAAEDLARPLEEMGLAIARSLLEMFEGVPDGHPLFRQFSFFHRGERGAYEELLDRHADARRPRGATAARDHDMLVNLAFRYVETRHRLGLLDDSLKERIVRARVVFRELLPRALESAVAFYDPDHLCPAASLADNLLFGRVAHDVAGAEEKVQEMVTAILTEKGLDDLVFASGLAARISPGDMRAMAGRERLLDLARCLARRPEMLVATGVTESLSAAQAEALLVRLRAEMAGRSLFVTMRSAGLAADMETVVFARGAANRAPAAMTAA
ncbi:ATP-binding cassette domain-containing protein [Camelimonas abortus]|uniref:ATP-binding cassette domain-containing protein n=1 Tax=Camelimonas abortus TaxID=1017184 RepID=A0ABV7LHG2_9HYPH